MIILKVVNFLRFWRFKRVSSVTKLSPSSQNQRVASYEVGGDEQPRIFSTDDLYDSTDMDALINAAYRQMFFHALRAIARLFWSRSCATVKLPCVTLSVVWPCHPRSTTASTRRTATTSLLNTAFKKSWAAKCITIAKKIAWSIKVANKGIPGPSR
jgi:phycobilisome rod-core linker protein